MGPAVECNGSKHWYQDGLLHRPDGPAIEDANGDKHWCQDGLLHRIDGPAIEYANGNKCWYIRGKEMTEAEFLAATQPVVELTVAEVEKLLGKRVKIVKQLRAQCKNCAIIQAMQQTSKASLLQCLT